MTKQNSPIDDLYKAQAHLYAAIGNDRSFTNEVDFLWDQFYGTQANVPLPKVLELFAGPAWHASTLIKRYSAPAYCIDSSEQMKAIACDENGIDPSNYFLSILPNLPQVSTIQNSVDCVLIMRYSLGYLVPDEVERLFSSLLKIMSPQGVIVIELHDIRLLLADLNSLAIRERVLHTEHGQIVKCTWPHGPIVWQSDDWMAHMQVKIEVTSCEDSANIFEYTSSEFIYSVKECERIARRIGGFSFERIVDQTNHNFVHSNLLVLRKA